MCHLLISIPSKFFIILILLVTLVAQQDAFAEVNSKQIDLTMLKKVMGNNFDKKKLIQTIEMLKANGMIDQKMAKKFAEKFSKISDSDFKKMKENAIKKINDGTFTTQIQKALKKSKMKNKMKQRSIKTTNKTTNDTHKVPSINKESDESNESNESKEGKEDNSKEKSFNLNKLTK